MTPSFTQIEAVVFDIGGVFLVPHPEPVGNALSAAGIAITDDPVRFRSAHYHGARGLTDRMLNEDHVDELNLDSWRDYDLAYFSHLGVANDNLESAHRARAAQREMKVADIWRLTLDDNIEAFHRMSESGHRLAILSNNDGTAAEQMQAHSVCQVGEGDLPEVEVIIDSTLVGIAKPDPAIFGYVLDAIDLPADRVLYVGDTVHADVKGANAAGLPVVQLDPHNLHSDFDHHRADDIAAVAALLNPT